MAHSANLVPDGFTPPSESPSRLNASTGDARRLLPASAYDALAFQAAEDASIWTRMWVAIGFVADVGEAGDILPYTSGNHGIHAERQEDGSLIGRFNKAQHGGCRMVPLQCQTGARTHCSFTSCGYSYDRPAIKASDPTRERYLDQYLGLRPERLLPVPVREWGPLLVSCLDPSQKAPFEWPEADDLISHDQRDIGGDTIWKEYQANWKHLAIALAEGAEGTVLFPNVVVRKTGHGTCLVVLQPVALDRTLCRIRLLTADSDLSAARAQMLDDLAECGEAAAQMQKAGEDLVHDDARMTFERKIRAAVDRLAVEERTDVLFSTSDKGGW